MKLLGILILSFFGLLLFCSNGIAARGDILLENRGYIFGAKDILQFKVLVQNPEISLETNPLKPKEMAVFSNSAVHHIKSGYLDVYLRNVTQNTDYQYCLTQPYFDYATNVTIFGWNDGSTMRCEYSEPGEGE